MSRPSGRYLTTAHYALSWGRNSESVSKGFGSSEDEAMQRAISLVDEMRRDGPSLPIRSVTVRDWATGSSLKDARLVYEASYHHAAQGLTDNDEYAARVHDWHDCRGQDGCQPGPEQLKVANGLLGLV